MTYIVSIFWYVRVYLLTCRGARRAVAAAVERRTWRSVPVNWCGADVEDDAWSDDLSQPVGVAWSLHGAGRGHAARHVATALRHHDATLGRCLPAAARRLGRPRHRRRAPPTDLRVEGADSSCRGRRAVLRVSELVTSLPVAVRRARAPLRRPASAAAAVRRVRLRQGAQQGQAARRPQGTASDAVDRRTANRYSKAASWRLRLCVRRIRYQLHLSVTSQPYSRIISDIFVMLFNYFCAQFAVGISVVVQLSIKCLKLVYLSSSLSLCLQDLTLRCIHFI